MNQAAPASLSDNGKLHTSQKSQSQSRLTLPEREPEGRGGIRRRVTGTTIMQDGKTGEAFCKMIAIRQNYLISSQSKCVMLTQQAPSSRQGEITPSAMHIAAVRHLGFVKFKFLMVGTVKRPFLHQRTKFRKDRSNRCGDIAISVIFKMAAAAFKNPKF